MENFLILFRGQDGRSLRENPEAFESHLQRLGAWMESLKPDGEVIAAEPLAPSSTLIRSGARVKTDGPFIEGKEMVGGYLRFRCISPERAIAWAQQCPIFEFKDGIVELRAIE
ncbi:MAG: YciI family protein [Bacteroidia bacterium]